MKIEKRLFQWDINQQITECIGIYVDFVVGDEVFRVEVQNNTCNIPDEFLQISGLHNIYECFEDGTRCEHKIDVAARPIPPDYVFTPAQKITFDALIQKVDDVIAEAQAIIDQGAIKGDKGDKGDSYTITDADYEAIAEMVNVPTDEHINALIDAALGVIENGTY